MRRKKLLDTMFVLLLSIGGLCAQEALGTTGGEAVGSGGTASFSVGQLAYTTVTGSDGSITQGVQQPYEILMVGLYESAIDIELSAYPNPTSDFLSLEVDFIDLSNLSIQLINMQGIVLVSQELSDAVTQIEMENLASGIYFLNVNNNNEIVKTFKIIKQ